MTVALLESYFDFFYAKAILDNMNDVIIKKCYGCINNKLSQTDHQCLNLSREDWLHLYLEDILLCVDESDILQKWESSVSMVEDVELVAMYRFKLYCSDWRDTDMKTDAWKSKMIRMTLQILHLEKRF